MKKTERLLGEGLNISWVGAETKRTVTDKFYKSTASEGNCTVADCDFSTLSRRRLHDHIVIHHIIYATDCNYLTSRRDSAVKHLKTCHNRRGSITQTDAGSWRRLRKADPDFRISCPPLPLSYLQYYQAFRCSEERTASNSLPIAVKRIGTTEGGREVLDRPEEPPIVAERNVDL